MRSPKRASQRAPKSLFPAPIRLRVVSRRCQLVLLRAVGQHRPDLIAARTIGLKNNVAPVGRPGREIVSSAIVCQLHELTAGDVHHIDILRPRGARTVVTNPRKSEELPVWGPRWRNGITLVGHLLWVGAISLHHVNLRQTRPTADP